MITNDVSRMSYVGKTKVEVTPIQRKGSSIPKEWHVNI